jgi:hypothetical protein
MDENKKVSLRETKIFVLQNATIGTKWQFHWIIVCCCFILICCVLFWFDLFWSVRCRFQRFTISHKEFSLNDCIRCGMKDYWVLEMNHNWSNVHEGLTIWQAASRYDCYDAIGSSYLSTDQIIKDQYTPTCQTNWISTRTNCQIIRTRSEISSSRKHSEFRNSRISSNRPSKTFGTYFRRWLDWQLSGRLDESMNEWMNESISQSYRMSDKSLALDARSVESSINDRRSPGLDHEASYL